MRDRARNLAIGIALTPVTVLGLVAVFTRGTVEVVLGGLGIALTAAAVAVIYFLERPLPRRSSRSTPRAPSAPGSSGSRHAHEAGGAESATERVVDLDVGTRWDREHPDAWLVQRDGGAALILRPDAGDADRRLVVLVWSRCTAAHVGPPSAENRSEHPLYSRGLRECAWAAEVRDSRWATNGDRHFVILTKDETIEVVAPTMIVHRVDRIRLAASSTDEARE